jgi:hypothetical protein
MFRNPNSVQSDTDRTRRSYSNMLSGLKNTLADYNPVMGIRQLVNAHCCVIDDRDAIIYPRDLQNTDPHAFECLKRYTINNDILIKADARVANKSVSNDRRKNNVVAQSMLIISGMLCSNFATAASSNSDISAIPEVKVIEQQQATTNRPYTLRAGKRFITKPYGKREQILTIAKEVKALGTAKKVSTRGIKMPQGYANSSIVKYDHTVYSDKDAMTFSYYEGEGFSALGYHHKGEVILDVLDGGGVFSAPELWGPYDQVIGGKRRAKMKMLMGDATQDGMGLLRSGYAIGLVPEMSKRKLSILGVAYSRAVDVAYDKMIVAAVERKTSKETTTILASTLARDLQKTGTGFSEIGETLVLH